MKIVDEEKLFTLLHSETKLGDSERTAVATFLLDLMGGRDDDSPFRNIDDVLDELDCLAEAVAGLKARVAREFSL